MPYGPAYPRSRLGFLADGSRIHEPLDRDLMRPSPPGLLGASLGVELVSRGGAPGQSSVCGMRRRNVRSRLGLRGEAQKVWQTQHRGVRFVGFCRSGKGGSRLQEY